MNDETRQMREMLFDRIVLGLALIGLVTTLIAMVTGGFSSPWFFRAMALMIVALVAFGLRRVSQLVVAAYVLVLELIGIATGILLQTGATGFTPYLFIPIIIITGLILSPAATLAVGILSILVIVVILVLTQQLSVANLIILLPPFSLIILASLLAVESRRYVEKLGERLVESRKLLRERTLEMMEAQGKITELQTKAEDLKQQLLTTQGETHQAQQMALQKSHGLYELIKGSIQELDTSVENLERVIDQISENPSPEERASLLEEVWQKIYHLNNLVVNLEDMAQLKNNRISLNYQSVDIAHLINEIVGTTRGLARGKNLEIRCQVPQHLPELQIDPVRIRQALLYVLNNAVKYTDQGIIEIQAELNAKELMIFVSDTGIGMHREEMDLVFKEFGRGSGTLAKQRQGTGLGLAISKSLVELHGGRMWVTSVLGVGSTFYITLPLGPLPGKVPAAIPAPIPQPAVVSIPESEPPPITAIPFPGEDETLLSPQPVTEPPVTAKPSFGSPVGRFGPTYIGRFAFVLLGLLLIIASCVALLAVFYGPVSQEEIAATESAPPTSTAISLVVTEITQPEESVVPVLDDTPSVTSSPTATSQPSNTPIPSPTDTPPSPPTDTPAVATATSTSTSTPTQEPPSPTPAPTQTPPPTATNTPQPDTREAASVTSVQPPIVRSRAKGLSFVSDQAGGQFVAFQPLDEKSGSSLNEAGGIVGDSNLSWSPNGDRVLFTTKRDGNYEIYIANADGSQPFNLTQSAGYDTQPAWSPDGRKIAFSSQRNGNIDIYVMDADGRNLRRLTTGRGYEEWSVWSPDGRKIAFVSDQTGNIEIYTIDVDGSNLQQVTDHPADDWPAVWSPDSRRILFSSNRDKNWNLYIVDTDGSNLQRLTNDPADEREPAWSPDGDTIAFVYNGSGNWNIYTIPAPPRSFTEIPRRAWTQFTDTPANERYPAWSP